MRLDLSSTSSSRRQNNLADVNLGVAWESPLREFGTSLQNFIAGPRPTKDIAPLPDGALRIDWIRGRLPGRAFLASSLWHAAAIFVLVLPIWGFLPTPEQTLAPLQIELTYVPARDLPRISLPASKQKAGSPRNPTTEASRRIVHNGADAYNPRQSILSIPVQITHPRQTIIQPDAPAAAPKIDVQLPDIVQWAAAPTKPTLQFSAAAAVPRARQHFDRDVAMPEIANNDKNSALMNIAATSPINPHPQMPVSSASAAVSQNRQFRPDAATAPEITAVAGDANLRRVIALSSAPAPPVPEISVPRENLAAPIAISPQGKTRGTPGVSERSSNPDSVGGATSVSGAGVPGAGAGSGERLPAAVSVAGGSRGGIVPADIHPGKLNLNPTISDQTFSRKGPLVGNGLDATVAPEKVLAGKQVYTLNINLPNLTSVAGSWIVSFAQLDETDQPPYKTRGELSGPVPVEKVDPKYPPQLIKEHVQGQVVLYAIIGKEGSVRGVQLLHGIEPDLDKNAMEAFARWKFRPGTRDGVPVDLEAVVNIPFRYRSLE